MYNDCLKKKKEKRIYLSWSRNKFTIGIKFILHFYIKTRRTKFYNKHKSCDSLKSLHYLQ